jgi:hypothetical protein
MCTSGVLRRYLVISRASFPVMPAMVTVVVGDAIVVEI